MIKEATQKLIGQQDLTYTEAREVMCEIMAGQTSPVQTAAYLTALAIRGATIEVITASAAEMRQHALTIQHQIPDLFEIVGTGGDGAHSFNISTTASFVIAAGDVKVAKHGNRAASSRSGAADCLEASGANIDLPPERALELLDHPGICFLFAQKYHTSMKYVAPVRRELGIRTIFNILGPLTNPAAANIQLLGVFDGALVEPLAHVLSNLGVRRGMVVFGQDRLDEISLSSATEVCEFENGNFNRYILTPEQLGFTRCEKAELLGGTPQENAQITREILSGGKGPKRDAVQVNAGAGLYLAGKASSLPEGIRMAGELIESGAAAAKLEQFVHESNQVRQPA